MNNVDRCGWCDQVVDGDTELACECSWCGAVQHANCATTCCEQGITSSVDAWLAGLAESQLERL